MSSFQGPTRSWVAAALAVGPFANASASIAQLDTTLLNGATALTVPMGGAFHVRIALDAPQPTVFNAALFRLVFTVEGTQVLDYDWMPPFVTGGATDFSLEGLTLPVTVIDGTLAGPGYPVGTPDVEFGNVSILFDSLGGPVMELFIRAPLDARPGSTFYVAAVPDLFTDGFTIVPVETGSILAVSIVDSDVFADLSCAKWMTRSAPAI